MATHKKEVSITDLQQKILSNDLYNDMSVINSNLVAFEEELWSPSATA